MSITHNVNGEHLTLLQNGTAYFPQLCADIKAAQRSIYIETYIFAMDPTGHMVASALKCAAARGVLVHVLLDGYGSAELPQHWVEDMNAANVEVLWFRREVSPFTLKRNRMRRLRRLHRKLVVVDSNVAFVGGINIVDDVPVNDASEFPRLDYAVRIQGALAGDIHLVMQQLWRLVSWVSFHKRSKELPRFFLGKSKRSITPNIRLVLRDNLRHRHDIETEYLGAIGNAKREVIIASAYFLPRRVFRQAVMRAAQRGVRVVLLLQGRVEYRIQHYATHALYDQFLAKGIEIYEYQPSFLHAKVAVVDGDWATVGSSNIDPFSLLLAREANLVVKDTGFAEELRASLLQAITHHAIRIGDEFDVQRNWMQKLVSRISYMIVRLMIQLIGGRSKGPE